ncbi:membrane protein insertase YidC [Patescibacteria group bacterium]|nr:membrane protein insertase YidC [Patescibacteria group bacterium]
MAHIFNLILVQPLLNLMVLVYNLVPDIGVAIIVLTLIIRALLLPSFGKSLRAQKQMTDLQPKLNALREQHKGNKEAEARAMMELYREHKVSPFGSCLPLLIQIPLLIALYRVFIVGLGSGADLNPLLYSFVHAPAHISPYFLKVIDLSKPSIVFGIIAGIAQFFQSKMMLPKAGGGDATTKALQFQTLYFLPLITILFSLRLPAGLPLYWIVTTLFAVGQQYYIMKTNPTTA